MVLVHRSCYVCRLCLNQWNVFAEAKFAEAVPFLCYTVVDTFV